MIAKGSTKLGLIAFTALLTMPVGQAMAYGQSWRPANAGMGPGSWAPPVQAPGERSRSLAPHWRAAVPAARVTPMYQPARPRLVAPSVRYRPPAARQWQHSRRVMAPVRQAVAHAAPRVYAPRPHYRPMEMPHRYAAPAFTRQFGWRPAAQPLRVKRQPDFASVQPYGRAYGQATAQQGQQTRWRPVTAQAPWSGPAQARFNPRSVPGQRYAGRMPMMPGHHAYAYGQPYAALPPFGPQFGWQPDLTPYGMMPGGMPMMVPYAYAPGPQPGMPREPASRDDIERFGRHMPDIYGERREAWQRDCSWCGSGS